MAQASTALELCACHVHGAFPMLAAAALPQLSRHARRRPMCRPGVASSGARQPAGVRGVVHIPAMIWGAAKLGALVGGLSTKHILGVGLAKKVVQTVGIRRALQMTSELNDKLLARGAHSKAVHETVATSLRTLEQQLVSLGQSGSLRAVETWLAGLEKHAPALAVEVGKVYLDSWTPVKAAKTVMKGVPRDAPALAPPSVIAGHSQQEWQTKIHGAFPELQRCRIIVLPPEEKANESVE